MFGVRISIKLTNLKTEQTTMNQNFSTQELANDAAWDKLAELLNSISPEHVHSYQIGVFRK